MSLADAGLALVLDGARLAEVVGHPVRVAAVRPKPGVSTVAALLDEQGRPWGWIRTLTGRSRAKAGKAGRAAAAAGLAGQVHEAELVGRETLVQWGPVATDPRLVRHLAGLDVNELEILRHNPLRRLVARDGDRVVRVSAAEHRTRLTAVTGVLADQGVPVVEPLPATDALGEHVSWWPWVAGTDAAAHEPGPPAPAVLAEIGRAIALLHGADPGATSGLPERGWADLLAAATASVELLAQVSPGIAASARRVLGDLPRRQPDDLERVVCHGDLSLDQVLLRPDGSVLLTDLDRACLGPAVLDHASMVALDLAHGRGELAGVAAGYEQGRARPVVPGTWVAAVLLARVTEPWRAQDAGWRGELVRRTLLAGQVLGRHDTWARPELAVAR